MAGESKKCRYVSSALAKHGVGSFEFSVLQECDRADLPRVEGEWMRKLGTLYPGGYNLTSFTESGGRVMTEETRKRLGAALKGKPSSNRGRVFSAETREKMAAAKRGHKMDEKTRAALEVARRKRKGSTLSPEARANISAGNVKKWQDPTYRAKSVVSHQGPRTQAHRDSVSRSLSAKWQDQEFRAMMLAARSSTSG